MKKSVLKGLFLLSCIFFFSNVDLAAQSFRDVVDVRVDLPVELQTLKDSYKNLDRTLTNFRQDAILLSKQHESLEILTTQLDSNPTVEDAFIATLLKIGKGDFTEQDYIDGDFSSPEISDVHPFLDSFLKN